MIRNILSKMTRRGVHYMSLSILFFVLNALCGTAIVTVVLFLIDRQLSGGATISIARCAGLLVGLLLLKTIANAAADMSKHFAGFDLVEQLRQSIVLKLKKFSLGFFTNERLGAISTVIHKDVDNMEMVVGHLWTRMSADFIVALILGIGLFCLDWRMGLLMIALLPIALFSLYCRNALRYNNTEAGTGPSSNHGQPLCRVRKGHTRIKDIWRERDFQRKVRLVC